MDPKEEVGGGGQREKRERSQPQTVVVYKFCNNTVIVGNQ